VDSATLKANRANQVGHKQVYSLPLKLTLPAGLIEDARAAWDWLTARGAHSNDIILMGESLGTGVVAGFAAQLAVDSQPSDVAGFEPHLMLSWLRYFASRHRTRIRLQIIPAHARAVPAARLRAHPGPIALVPVRY